MEPKVIYEDEYLLVLDKPAGWIVNEAETTKGSPVIQSWLKKNFNYPIVANRELRSGIVHRLDKETSGILLVAKTHPAFENLQVQFKSRNVKKEYIALVHGKVDPPAGGEGEIDAPVGRLPWNRERFGVLPGGRDAVTIYKVIKYYSLITNHQVLFTFLELHPKTGRTHQIRIHMKYLGHSIVSDNFYAGRKTARRDKIFCVRLFLHASKISFTHPETKKALNIQSDLPKDLKNALASLEKISQTP